MEISEAIEIVAKRHGIDAATVMGHAHIFAEEVREVEEGAEMLKESTQDRIWRGKSIAVGCESLEDLLDSLENEAAFIRRCIEAKVEADFSNAEDDYICLSLTDEQERQIQSSIEG